MLIAFISDVHGNAAALRAVLEELDRRRPDHIFALGDLVGRGPEPERVVELIERRRIRTLRGNWDEWVAGVEGWDQRLKRKEWIEAARRLMKKKTAARVAEAPQRRRLIFDGITLVLAHGSPRDPVELLGPDSPEEQLAGAIAGTGADVVAVGHSHRPFVRRVGTTLVINAGSVGYPFNGDPRACFALLHLDPEPNAELVRIPYPLDDNLRAMRRAVKSGAVDAHGEQRYRRALLGEGPEPYDALHPTDRGSEALVKLLAKRIRTVYADRKISDIVTDEVAVRDLRVATRRLREALALARPLLAQRDLRSVVRALTELGRTLGQRRTSDVLAAGLAELTGEDRDLCARLVAAVEIRRKRTTARLLDTYTAEQLLEGGLQATALAMKPATDDVTIAAAAQELLRARLGKITAALPAIADEGAREGHHRLRIQLRRLRYASAILAEPWPHLELEVIEALTKSTHAALGKLNDAYDLARFLESRRARRVAHGANLAPLLERARADITARYREAKRRIDEHAGDLIARLERIQEQLG